MFTIQEIIEATGAELVNGDARGSVSGVSIDSRTIKAGEVFVAIEGGRFDGHNFIAQAQASGAKCVIVSRKLKNLPQITIVQVKDTTYALMALGFRHRSKFNIPVIAITGSNGKTTTKEMLRHILGNKFNVLHNPGTENNYFGVSLAILRLNKSHDLAILEIGTNNVGEIDKLSWMIQPTVGIITNIGQAHLKFFKTLKGVLAAKLELLQNLAPDGRIIFNDDDGLLSQINATTFKKITFGFKPSCDFRATKVDQVEGGVSFLVNDKHSVSLKTLGRHNVYNALASIACARCFDLTFSEIEQAFSCFKAPPMRMQLSSINNVNVVKDYYNSNPGSLGCALDYVKEYSCKGKKILVCGDMLELGKTAKGLHFDIGKKVAQDKLDCLITVGSLSRNVALGAREAGMTDDAIHEFRNVSQAAECLRKVVCPGDLVLVKGSRAMKMENVIDVL